MDCKEMAGLLPAYIDQELGIPELLEFEAHLQNCPACRQACATERELGARIRTQASYHAAPTQLAQRVRASLPVPESTPSRDTATKPFWHISWLQSFPRAAMAMTCLFALVLASGWVGALFNRPSAQDLLAEEVVASHVRSLQVDHLSDVVSSDQHTVKPWFNGKLDFSPPVDDLVAQGFPLEGGRLDYVGGHAVAALIYRIRKHPINVYVWPADKREAPSAVQDRHGYHYAHWSSGGMTYWVVSDCAADDIERFSRSLRTALADS